MDDPEAFVKEASDFVKHSVGVNEKVGLAVSGGIDSTVLAEILKSAIGENLYVIHMDHGFMRLIEGREESDIVAKMFSDFPNFIYRDDVRDRFYSAVQGIEDGDQKRAAFRDVYKSILNEEMQLSCCEWTADGTIKPDLNETRAGIKLQHNVDLGFSQKKLEPLASLTKQEVRALAKYLDIPHLRQPFPGPGLLVRTVGLFSREKLRVEKEVNDIVEQEYKQFMIEHCGKEMVIDWETGLQIPFQTFAVTFDYRMAKPKVFDIHGLRVIRGTYLDTRVTGLVDAGGRYERLYDKPFVILSGGPIYACPYYMNKSNALRIAKKTGSSRILYRIRQKETGDFAVAIRALNSVDVREAMPNFSGNVPEHAAIRILENVPDVRMVLFDATPKPPATVEYE